MLRKIASKSKPKRAAQGRAKGRSYGGMSDEERRRERRERFLQAGVAVFGEKGYAATTTRGLCQAAGLTQRYFYESFRDTEELFVEVARGLAASLERQLLAAEAGAPQEPSAQLKAVLACYFEILKQDPRSARIMLVEAYSANPPVGVLALEFSAKLSELLHTRMRAAFPAFASKALHTHLLAAGLVGATHHIALKWMLGGFREPVAEVVNTAFVVYFGPLLQLGAKSK